MEIRFFRAKDGAPYATLSDEWPGFNEALTDAIGSLPPRGSPERSVSTYWIDRAERVVQQMLERGESGVIQGGNAATLLFREGRVVATSQYELFDDQEMELADFLHVLAAWRTEVIRVRDNESPTIEETYRRNPYPD